MSLYVVMPQTSVQAGVAYNAWGSMIPSTAIFLEEGDIFETAYLVLICCGLGFGNVIDVL